MAVFTMEAKHKWGEKVSVKLPDGSVGIVVIPEGAKVGDKFSVAITKQPPVSPCYHKTSTLPPYSLSTSQSNCAQIDFFQKTLPGRFEFRVLASHKPGQTVAVQLPNGTVSSVVVPEGAKEGDVFVLSVE